MPQRGALTTLFSRHPSYGHYNRTVSSTSSRCKPCTGPLAAAVSRPQRGRKRKWAMAAADRARAYSHSSATAAATMSSPLMAKGVLTLRSKTAPAIIGPTIQPNEAKAKHLLTSRPRRPSREWR